MLSLSLSPFVAIAYYEALSFLFNRQVVASPHRAVGGQLPPLSGPGQLDKTCGYVSTNSVYAQQAYCEFTSYLRNFVRLLMLYVGLSHCAPVIYFFFYSTAFYLFSARHNPWRA